MYFNQMKQKTSSSSSYYYGGRKIPTNFPKYSKLEHRRLLLVEHCAALCQRKRSYKTLIADSYSTTPFTFPEGKSSGEYPKALLRKILCGRAVVHIIMISNSEINK
uniref:Uncharacterized protein n=1 Tax=Rhizophagus irregularis (strain DAOM 181602 / DAOM 197198 / MUCL 43194) TaxID=747089 RepID=U9TPL6_RHIID